MGRMQPVTLPSGAIVVRDENNGSVDTLATMQEALANASATRRGVVFSDVSDSSASPRQRLRRIAAGFAEHCDFAVFIGSHAHHAVKGAVSAGMDPADCHDFVSLEDAARWLKTTLQEGDLVFLKGRGTDHLSRLVLAQFGAIGCWKLRCTATRLCDVCTELRPAFDLEKALSPHVTGRAAAAPAGIRIVEAPGR